jgi:choline dehydrogenase-like flavoprotein
MEQVVVVGSGASGVHFALTLLRKGYRVLMLDVGRGSRAALRPDADFATLKAELPDPAAYLLGNDYGSLILPGNKSEYYGFPPSKEYVFAPTEEFRYQATGFAPLFSFAAGGLAQAWTGGCYPFNDRDLEEFPFRYRELAPYYAEVAERIGITGIRDDMEPFFPLHDSLSSPLTLDEHSQRLLDSYRGISNRLNRAYNFYMGRSRIAVLSASRDGRRPCDYSGRCLWGCPGESLYTPSITLRECQRYETFTYQPGMYVSHFRYAAGGKVKSVLARSSDDGALNEIPVGTLVLAAGALGSSRIVLESIARDTGQVQTLAGLMDNRQVLLPFLNLGMIGRPYETNTYQYHQLAIGVPGATSSDYVHGLVTTLKTALIHPIVQSLPFDLGTSLKVFRNIHSALGIVNVNFSDHRRPANAVTLGKAGGPLGDRELVIEYTAHSDEPARLRRAIRSFQKAMRQIGCFVPGFMSHVRPMGASVHYAGLLPMSAEGRPFTCTPWGQSRDFENLFVVDGTSLPSLPAKNLTFTLMANAVRVASLSFENERAGVGQARNAGGLS